MLGDVSSTQVHLTATFIPLAKDGPKKIVYWRGEDSRVIRAAQDWVVDGGHAIHILWVGSPHKIQEQIDKLGLQTKDG